MVKIANIKASIKLRNGEPLSFFKNVCVNKKLLHTEHANFIVISDLFTYIIFKMSPLTACNHVNVTKIRDFNGVSLAAAHLNRMFNVNAGLEDVTVDNITATADFKCAVHLPIFLQVCSANGDAKMSYNNEKFPGLFVRFDKGTAILFSSGKCVFIGHKLLAHVNDSFDKLYQNIQSHIKHDLRAHNHSL